MNIRPKTFDGPHTETPSVIEFTINVDDFADFCRGGAAALGLAGFVEGYTCTQLAPLRGVEVKTTWVRSDPAATYQVNADGGIRLLRYGA